MSKITITFERESPLPEWATPEVIAELYKKHGSLRKVGDIVGVSYEAIRLILKKNQVA